MTIFELPTSLDLVARFALPSVRTWGGKQDAEYKELLRQQARVILSADVASYQWFVFSIQCTVDARRGLVKRQAPDVENIPKLIIDAFTGLLYADDNLHHVRGVQVEAQWGEVESAEVFIYGGPPQSLTP